MSERARPTPAERHWCNLAHFFADELVERWHDEDPTDRTLAQFMGLTDPEYAMWVEGRYLELALSLRVREG